MERFSEIRDKQVVNVQDGRCLGYVCDFLIDWCTGCITALIVPGSNSKFANFFNIHGEIIIPWDRIERVGNDVVLVRIDEQLDRRRR